MRFSRRAPAISRRGSAVVRSAGGARRRWLVASAAFFIGAAFFACGNAAPSELLVPPPELPNEPDAGQTMMTGINDATLPEASGFVEDATTGRVRDATREAQPRCGPDTCDGGCCDSKTGACLDGTGDKACGTGGTECMACATGESCSAGFCSVADAADEAGCDPLTCIAPACGAFGKHCCTLKGACGCLLGTLCL